MPKRSKFDRAKETYWRGQILAQTESGLTVSAYCRREFVESESSDSLRSLTAVAWIKRLYEVEREAADAGLCAEEIRELRQEKSRQLLDDFEKWLRDQQAEVLPKSPLGQAIAYTLNNWKALGRYLEDGDLAIDNNVAESALRGIAVGRKNWLFAGSDRGGKTAAVLTSFTPVCRWHRQANLQGPRHRSLRLPPRRPRPNRHPPHEKTLRPPARQLAKPKHDAPDLNVNHTPGCGPAT